MASQGEWIECIVDADYEININYPHQIRRKSNKRIIKESISNSTGYVRCTLNNRFYRKHRIIALQFIENDDPENKTQVDHINHVRTDNRINNLRWVSSSENDMNRSIYNGYEAEYVDDISDEAIEVLEYNKYHFVDYYYVEKEDAFYFWNGIKFRRLKILYDKDGYALVTMRDIDNKNVKIYYTKFKRQYNLK